ncbi:hypothetical protein RD055328_02160 [Companilactobacillus sp. RD055328]|nr:hypothetical protein RD055328_02160 [Companilactobacillus sp. RD055328]
MKGTSDVSIILLLTAFALIVSLYFKFPIIGYSIALISFITCLILLFIRRS